MSNAPGRQEIVAEAPANWLANLAADLGVDNTIRNGMQVVLRRRALRWARGGHCTYRPGAAAIQCRPCAAERIGPAALTTLPRGARA